MRKRDAGKESFWRRVVSAQEQSGLSVRRYCQRKGLTESSFYAWKREIELRDREQAAEQTTGGERQRGAADASPREQADSFPRREAEKERHRLEISPRRDGAVSAFVPVQLAASLGGVIEVAHPGGCVVRLPAGFSAGALGQVLNVLDERAGSSA